MTIEALMDLKVTSVSRKSEPLSRAAAAIYVITQEDIRRSTATSIPELLRMVPGLDVAQIDGSTWAISARGLNAQYANYMLVLIDGRTVYNPTFNGVYWDVQDTLLEDIDRIEVICGPGAALWGQNAVNGVINITTKKASDTQGALVTAVAGNQETPTLAARYGGRAGSRGHYRVSQEYFNRQEQDLPAGAWAADGWHNLRLDSRGDWDLSDRDSLTALVSGYQGLERHQNQTVSLLPTPQPTIVNPMHIAGSDFLVKWQHTFSDRSDTSLQVYHDYTDRRDLDRTELLHTADFDFQHHIVISPRHDVVWGVGARYTVDHTTGSFRVSFDPHVSSNKTFSVFGQDEITILPSRLRIILGARLTNDNYAGTEIQPDARLLWSPYPEHSIWLAISRPIGEPSFASQAVRFTQSVQPGPGGVPIVATVLGNPGLGDEKTLSLQAGYRAQIAKELNLSAAGFYSRYAGVASTSMGVPFLDTDPAPPHLLLPINFENNVRGETHGLELDGTWQVNNRWRLATGYSLLLASFRDTAAASGSPPPSTTTASPQNQFQVRSYLNLPRNWEWDTSFYQVGRLATDNIPAHLSVDTRVGWRFGEGLSISLVGQNLLRPRQFEFGSSTGTINTTQIKRSGYAKFTWTF